MSRFQIIVFLFYSTLTFNHAYELLENHELAYATLTQKFFSPALGTTVAFFNISSPTARRNLSAVAGLSNTNGSITPFIFLAATSASLNANNTVAPRNNGGSPTPFELCTLLRWFQLTPCRNETLNSCGMSLNPGILYVPGPLVNSCPDCVHSDSSIVKRPWPWIKAPSICP